MTLWTSKDARKATGGQVIGADVYLFDDVEQASDAVAALDGVI